MNKVMNYLVEDKKLYKGVATVVYNHLADHPEILTEFENYIKTGSFNMSDGSCIEVEGYTAERLDKETYLTPVGAYNFLVYLKEFPEQAKSDLSNNIKKK